MTAVEWLISQYIKDGLFKKGVYEQAMEMEKQQIIDAVYEFSCRDSANHYYVKTYGNKALVDTFAPKKGIATRYAADRIDEKLSRLAENASFANPILAIHEAKKRREQNNTEEDVDNYSEIAE